MYSYTILGLRPIENLKARKELVRRCTMHAYEELSSGPPSRCRPPGSTFTCCLPPAPDPTSEVRRYKKYSDGYNRPFYDQCQVRRHP
jgi:hypothetical protein